MTKTIDLATVEAARADAGVFAEALMGERLWDHQLEVVRSTARHRCILSGRQSGKSRTLQVLALHTAFARPDQRVMVLSAGEEAAKNLLAEMIALTMASPLLSGSIADDDSRKLVLNNGSYIRCVPASEKQVRGTSNDLLLLDEAAFIEEPIWVAARYTMLARPGSRVVMASTPWGRQDRFFAVAWRAGRSLMGSPPAEGYESWHWPSTVSPLVDVTLLEQWRATTTEREFRQEVLAEWVDEAGAYFTFDELERSVADYELIDPGAAGRQMTVGGVDWGLSHDANTLVLLAVLADQDLYTDRDEGAPEQLVFFVPWLEEHFKLPYGRFIDRIVEVCAPEVGFEVYVMASEANGVGAMPTQELRTRLWQAGTGAHAASVHTDARRKETAFGALKMLLQQGRLVLPRHPALLRQLAALEYETSDSGNIKISVPERAGHDDLAMGLAQAVSCVRVSYPPRPPWAEPSGGWTVESGAGEVLVTPAGTRIRKRPRCWDMIEAFQAPRGGERPEQGW